MTTHTRDRPDDNDRRLRRWVKICVVIGIVELPFLMWLWLSPLAQPKPFTNHQDQITAALRQHGVSFTKVYLDQGWPDRINSQTYGANVTIYVADAAGGVSSSDASALSAASPINGRIECRVQKRKCWFQVARLGIERQELTDLVVPAAKPLKPDPTWRDRLREILARLGVRL